jgi:hypothetical protein
MTDAQATRALPRGSWFIMQPPSDLHGRGHIARVMVWACVLTRNTEWFEPVVWAACCHDLRRVDDGVDAWHGFRAGTWVRNKLPGKLKEPPEQLEWIASACDWHVCSDDKAEWDHPVLWRLKDADGLDRVRLYDLDRRFLRHPETQDWVEEAQDLYTATAEEQNPLKIWQAALGQGLPVRELLEFNERQVRNLAPRH